MSVTSDATTAVLDMMLRGPWSRRLRDQIGAVLRSCLAGPSGWIIVDLHHVEDPSAASVPFWLAAWRRARLGLPPTQLAFTLPTTTTLGWRLRNPQGPQPRVFTTTHEAHRAIGERMSRADRLQTRLPARPVSVRAARDLVAHGCRKWHLPHLLPDAPLIVSELATNAVQHARTDFILTVTRGDTGLHVAVRDGAPQFPHPAAPALASVRASLDERGQGLRLVHTLATAWGAMPAHGGKVVWATVEEPPPQSSRCVTAVNPHGDRSAAGSDVSPLR
ncbi:ATP-binding protein [Actinoplanes oblitus]|uniref:ATP-binding protein n=1 Tax=Actinoplanes oblitus TaxID=3040509 RepID=A0ABY8W9R2_9ACTN|nr:ATP-binding protein [Actinoplanes oblitus]WIM94097.1 ATP-binding protein [Actinoplanes oblitus]